MSGTRLTTEQINSLTLDEAIQALPPKRRQLLDLLPEHAWNITQAGLALGYAQSYATTCLSTTIKRDILFAKAMELQRAKVAAETGIDAAWWLREVHACYQRCQESGTDGKARDETNASAYLEKLAKHLGTYEADNRQRVPQLGIFIT